MTRRPASPKGGSCCARYHRPPETATYDTDPRIAEVQARIDAAGAARPELQAMHPMGATLSQECVVMMGEAMCTALFHNQFRVPSYQDWVDDSSCSLCGFCSPGSADPAL